MNGTTALLVFDDHVGLGPVVGHRDQVHARLPVLAQGDSDLGERETGIQGLGANQVGRNVLVTQTEPGRLDSVGRQFILDSEGLALAAPAALDTDAAAEGVHHGVEIGADPQAVHPDVIAGVTDDSDVGIGAGDLESGEEPGSADSSGQGGDAHGGILPVTQVIGGGGPGSASRGQFLEPLEADPPRRRSIRPDRPAPSRQTLPAAAGKALERVSPEKRTNQPKSLEIQGFFGKNLKNDRFCPNRA